MKINPTFSQRVRDLRSLGLTREQRTEITVNTAGIFNTFRAMAVDCLIDHFKEKGAREEPVYRSIMETLSSCPDPTYAPYFYQPQRF